LNIEDRSIDMLFIISVRVPGICGQTKHSRRLAGQTAVMVVQLRCNHNEQTYGKLPSPSLKAPKSSE
jgi:hypothetical protein